MASEAVSKAGQAAINTLVERGRALDFAVEVEVPVPGGRIDVVWFLSGKGLPEVLGRLPAVAFEVGAFTVLAQRKRPRSSRAGGPASTSRATTSTSST